MIVLASASAVRARLLADAGVAFTTAPSGVDEVSVKTTLLATGAAPRALAQHLADAKALGAPAGSDDLVIGADQTLDLDGELIEKAADLAEARTRLKSLRGRAHTLHAAASLARGGEIIWRGVASPIVNLRAFSDDFLEAYLSECGEAALTSVGCYHLEGRGGQLIGSMQGDYFSVLGLPLIGLLAALRRAGALPS